MKSEIYDALPTSQSMAATFNGPWISVGELRGFAIDLVLAGGGTPGGAFKLQWTNDISVGGSYDVASSSYTVTDDGSNGWQVVDPTYRFVRVVYTRTSGTATVSCSKMNRKFY